MDTAAWAAIVVLAALRGRLLAAERPAGRLVTPPDGPGYGNWPVADQPALSACSGHAAPGARDRGRVDAALEVRLGGLRCRGRG